VSGVPQGSCLGPVLFCIYIKSLQPSSSKIPCVKYADDTSFVISGRNVADTVGIVNRELNHVESWCLRNNMKLNKNKTQVLYFNFNKKENFLNIDIYLTKEIKFLGFTISNNWKWTSHINLIISKLSSRLHILRVLKNTLTKKDLLIIYYAYFQSILDYNFPLISSLTKKDISRVNSITKRAHRIICGSTCENKCFPNFKDRSNLLSQNLFTHVINEPSHIINALLPVRSTRSNRFLLPIINSDRSLRTFIISNAITFNDSNCSKLSHS
jgi:Reverse transcriptase (RNA-dependent DNA polymerase)